jgi:hypothetical protein
MTTYRNKTTGAWDLTEQDIRQANPQVMYPAIFSDDNYELVFAAPRPIYDSVTQLVQVTDPLFIEAKGHWEQQWLVVEIYPIEADRLEAIAANLTSLIDTFVIQVGKDTDIVIKSAVGERLNEYNLAEKEATEFKLAGYSGTVPTSVGSWATAKRWTATQAADDILAAAQVLLIAQQAIRTNRLQAKEDAKLAVDIDALNVVRLTWQTFLTYIKDHLGVDV